ncbi:hypothetical protein [Hymenobacter fodinae]|uniref:Uncharacterized protein n=1 Tax=Hymenobacter fodinae TaxID=2510796 RepID=A0A4Z0PB66_9BACT|nr:hypothetical protein [Hymenobacter fodinae]TGE09824.1 hypothetical protein EU556_03065 [Hymenobacter fodinae]
MPSPPPDSPALQLLQQLAAHGELLPQPGIQRRTLSLHDHWLSEEEAEEATLSFATLSSLQDYRFYLREEERFVHLLASLFRGNEILFVHPADGTVRPLVSWAEFIAVSTSGLREQTPFTLYIPSMHMLLCSAYDLNVSVYFLDDRSPIVFAELALAYGLHVL